MCTILTAEQVLQLQEKLESTPEVYELPIINNGLYKIQNTKTNRHIFLRLTTNTPDSAFFPGQRVLSYKGADRYIPFAIVNGEEIEILPKNKGIDGKQSVWEHYAEVFLDLVTNGDDSELCKEEYRINVKSKCVECNQDIDSIDEIQRGICCHCYA